MNDTENEILKKTKNGDENSVNELLISNKTLVSAIARKYYLLGGDIDDLIQEGMIGLLNAINSFDESKSVTFRNYASRLIERAIISAIRRENSKKNDVLDSSVSVDTNEYVQIDNYPEKDIISEENCNEILSEIVTKLSDFEKSVVELYLKGYMYVDIAKILNRTPKTIDNALHRIKNKLKYLKERV